VGPPLLWGGFSLWQRFAQPAVVINVPAMGPAPLAFDFAFPVALPDPPETEAIKPWVHTHVPFHDPRRAVVDGS
jgi:hypothetical protein